MNLDEPRTGVSALEAFREDAVDERLPAESDLCRHVRRALDLPFQIGLSVKAFGPEAPPPLSWEAWPALARAVPARRREFVFGRQCARTALASVGGDGHAPLPSQADRSPGWPEGWTGSISHAEGVAGAIAGRLDRYRGLGFDVESLGALERIIEIAPLIATAAELDRLTRAEDVLAVFSAKESLFKGLNPGHFMDFDAAEVVGLDDAILCLRLTRDWSRDWTEGLEVRVRRSVIGPWMFTALAVS